MGNAPSNPPGCGQPAKYYNGNQYGISTAKSHYRDTNSLGGMRGASINRDNYKGSIPTWGPVSMHSMPPYYQPPACPPPPSGGGGGGCFLPDTLVRMADGSTKPICQVQAGEMVRSGRGAFASTRVVFVDSEVLATATFVGFNGLLPFATMTHRFMQHDKQDVGMSLSPDGSIGLQHWDVVDLMEKGSKAVRYGDVCTVSFIRAMTLDNARVYNLITEDHTYTVHDFSVFDDFPDIFKAPVCAMRILHIVKEAVKSDAPARHVQEWIDLYKSHPVSHDDIPQSEAEWEQKLGELFGLFEQCPMAVRLAEALWREGHTTLS